MPISVDREKKLPAGWRWVKLADVCEIIAGQSPPSSAYRDFPCGLPFFQGKADFGEITPTARIWCIEPKKIALPADILISVRAPVGPTNISNVKCCIGRGLAAIRCRQVVERDFIFFTFRNFERKLAKKGSGSTFEAIGRQQLESFQFPIPPLPEQRRIARILREQMAAVDKARAAAQERIAAIKALPAAYLRQVYPKLGQPLPAAWRWVRLGEVIQEAQTGFACGKREANGVIQLRMNNVDTLGNFIWEEVLRVPKNIKNIENYFLKPDDVLFNNTNSTDLVGKSALFIGYIEPVVYSNHFTRLRVVNDRLFPYFLVRWLNHQWQSGVFVAICNRWIGQSAVKSDKLLKLVIPLPSLSEQRRISEHFEAQMATADKTRKAAEEELKTINTLPAALLRRAFQGEL